MKKKVTISLITIVLAATALWWFVLKAPAEDTSGVLVHPKRGTSAITVTTTGELIDKNSKDIRGPEGVRAIGIWQMKLSNLVAEGTQVKAGDFVADLDQQEIAAKIREAQLNIQKSQAEYNSA